MVSDEGQQRAANTIHEAARTIERATINFTDRLMLHEQRLTELVERFEQAIERYILDYPGPNG